MKYLFSVPFIAITYAFYYGFGGLVASLAWLLTFLWYVSPDRANKQFQSAWFEWEICGGALILCVLLSVIAYIFGAIFLLSYLLS